MDDDARQDDTMYRVVFNEENQWSLWPAGRAIPAGWSYAGFTGTKAEALAWIETHWDPGAPRPPSPAPLPGE